MCSALSNAAVRSGVLAADPPRVRQREQRDAAVVFGIDGPGEVEPGQRAKSDATAIIVSTAAQDDRSSGPRAATIPRNANPAQ